MKRCPACQATYKDDAPDFCPNDGMRLVKQEAAAFDPEKTVLASGARRSEQAPPPAPQPQQPTAPPASEMPAPAPSQPQAQSNIPQQGWQQQGGIQAAQAGWPTPQQPQQQPAPQWGGPYQQQQQSPGQQYGAAFPQAAPAGKRRAVAIAALVFGFNAVTIMLIRVVSNMDFLYAMMLALSILGILLGAAALFLALKNSYRFAGVELAIAGLALGVTGLVYTLLTW